MTEITKEDDIIARAIDWLDNGQKVALATVVNTWGSSPRPAGSQLAVNENQSFVGSVSGGCIEGAVIETAMKLMVDCKPKLLEFSITNELAWEVGLACGGKVEVFVERLS